MMEQQHAVVIGAGLAGLLAARVLSDHAQVVTVIDRDTLPEEVEPRTGVAQSRHAHGLVARGFEIFESLFPGLQEDLLERGVVPGDFNSSINWYMGGELLAPGESGLISLPATRPTLEFVVRERVSELENVTIRDRVEASDLHVEGRRVTGLELYDLRREASEDVDTDLVVDCSGRGARLTRWMESHDLTPPRQETVEIDLAYTSAQLAVREDPFGEKMATMLANSPSAPRGCFFYRSPQGGNVVELSLTGMLGDHAPTDQAGFMDFARSLPVPSVYESLQGAEFVSGPVKLTFPASQWRHFESCDDMFEGLVPLGDAICSLNPIYAQGMTVAALEVVELEHQLFKKHFSTKAYLQACAKIVGKAWAMSAGSDLGYPDAKGKRTFSAKVANAYVARLHRAATRDPELTNAFFEVAGLTRSPAALFRPNILVKVLWSSLKSRAPHNIATLRSDPSNA